MNVSQEQITEMLMQMHKQCEFFHHSVKYNPRDDQAFASWGSMLMHLSMVCEQQEEKKKYLKEAIEKLERALELNQDSRTHEGELAVFSLGNALYFEFFLEKNDSKAEKSLKAAKLKFEESLKKDSDNISYKQMIEQLSTAHEQRRAAHEHLSRLEGKSDDEKKVEIRKMQVQMLDSVVDNNRKAVQTDPKNAVLLSELAKSLFELAMLQNRQEAQETLKEALEVCQKSIGINASEVAVIWVRGVLRQAYSKVTGDANEARQLDADSKMDFDAVMKAETDPAKKDALKKEKELLFGTIKAWTENITFMEGKSESKDAIKKKGTPKAQRSVAPGTSASAKSPSQGGYSEDVTSGSGSSLAMAVGVVLVVAVGVWWFKRSNK